jgi:hypothetical protein
MVGMERAIYCKYDTFYPIFRTFFGGQLKKKTCDKQLPYRTRAMERKITEHGKKSLSY